MGSVPGGIEPVGNVAVRISRHERPIAGSVPAAPGTRLAASDAVSLALAAAIAAAAKDDEEVALIIAMMEMG